MHSTACRLPESLPALLLLFATHRRSSDDSLLRGSVAAADGGRRHTLLSQSVHHSRGGVAAEVRAGLLSSRRALLMLACAHALPAAEATCACNVAVNQLLRRGEPLGWQGGAGCAMSLVGMVVLSHPPMLFGGHEQWGPRRVWGTATGVVSAFFCAAAFISIRWAAGAALVAASCRCALHAPCARRQLHASTPRPLSVTAPPAAHACRRVTRPPFADL